MQLPHHHHYRCVELPHHFFLITSSNFCKNHNIQNQSMSCKIKDSTLYSIIKLLNRKSSRSYQLCLKYKCSYRWNLRVILVHLCKYIYIYIKCAFNTYSSCAEYFALNSFHKISTCRFRLFMNLWKITQLLDKQTMCNDLFKFVPSFSQKCFLCLCLSNHF